jgi:hypothetical protein
MNMQCSYSPRGGVTASVPITTLLGAISFDPVVSGTEFIFQAELLWYAAWDDGLLRFIIFVTKEILRTGLCQGLNIPVMSF